MEPPEGYYGVKNNPRGEISDMIAWQSENELPLRKWGGETKDFAVYTKGTRTKYTRL